MTMKLTGLNDIFNALDKVSVKLAAGRRKAFTRIGFIIKSQAVKYAPVITGNLRGSTFTDVTDDHVSIGFTASYAANVHENMQGRSPKFLERAVNENHARILEELEKEGIK